MKRILLAIANAISLIWRLLPARLRVTLISGLLILESRGDAAAGLRNLFRIEEKLHWIINERAMAYGEGIHPKHRLTRYHDFFVSNIPAGSKVLDIGCGYGAVARSIAKGVPGSRVTGVEINDARVAQARAGESLPNLDFIQADARTSLPPEKCDVVVLSNILEHIETRVDFLKDILRQVQPGRVLIRVPLFERDWSMPMRKELGINYFSDDEHFIEHRLDEFVAEVRAAGLEPSGIQTFWGEIWADCRPVAA